MNKLKIDKINIGTDSKIVMRKEIKNLSIDGPYN